MANAAVTYDQLRASFSHDKFEPLYLFYGDESFLMAELQELLIARALQPHERDFNLDILYGSEVDVRQVLSACAGFPMMADRRVVIVRDFDKLKDNKLFASYAERPNTKAVVVLVCGGKANFSTHPYRALKAHAVCGEFASIEPKRLPGWMQRRIHASGREIEPRALQMLADSVGPGLATVATELDKLITYAGERTTLTPDDVIRASGQTREYNVFELQRRLAEYRFAEALHVAERLLRQSTNSRGDALRMLYVLGSFFVKLWKLSDAKRRGAAEAEMVRTANVRKYFLREYLQALRNWDDKRLDRAFSALLAADFELKGGSSRNEELVIMLMLRRMVGETATARAA